MPGQDEHQHTLPEGAPDRPDGGPPLQHVLRPETVDRAELARRARRSFIAAGLASAVATGAWRWLRTRREDDEALWPLRRGYELNEQVARDLFSAHSGVTEQRFGTAPQRPRVNGDIGLDGTVDPDNYRLNLSGIATDSGVASLTLQQIRALPKVEVAMRLCCIEGWSVMVNWGGARYADFIAKYPPITRSGRAYSAQDPADLFDYVAMATPDNGYYVGLDIMSVIHPQTLLAYEIDGKPLAPEHGAPLRLVIPTKYGIKNIKRIGSIRYSGVRPADYWAQQGYDWYSGL